MAQAWRIVREKHAATAFSGAGAAKAGGRWNSRGLQVVYTSETRALAALETLAHLTPPLQLKYVIFRAAFADELIERVPAAKLPQDWQAFPAPVSTRRIGDDWIKSLRSAVLAVPSVLVRQETNYLINPAHPEFAHIQISLPEPFAFDSRLLA